MLPDITLYSDTRWSDLLFIFRERIKEKLLIRGTAERQEIILEELDILWGKMFSEQLSWTSI